MDISRFQAFFSYSHHDAKTDPEFINTFTVNLFARINAKLVNASVELWIDRNDIRTGEIWSTTIEEAITSSQVFFLILSPKWIESDYCRREYAHFVENVENNYSIGKYVIPLLIRDLGNQVKFFTDEQKSAFGSIFERQYKKTLSTDYLNTTSNHHNGLLEDVADDVVGILDRIRGLPTPSSLLPRVDRRAQTSQKAEFSSAAHNIFDVDLISDGEVVVDKTNSGGAQAVLAYVQFLPKLYLQTSIARIDFSVRRAFLSLSDGGKNAIRRLEEIPSSPTAATNVYYVHKLNRRDDLTVCINPSAGRNVLGDLPLPPSPGENRLSKVACVSAPFDTSLLAAEVEVKLDAEGLHVFSSKETANMAMPLQKKIEAILTIAVEKKLSDDEGKITKVLPVRERQI